MHGLRAPSATSRSPGFQRDHVPARGDNSATTPRPARPRPGHDHRRSTLWAIAGSSLLGPPYPARWWNVARGTGLGRDLGVRYPPCVALLPAASPSARAGAPVPAVASNHITVVLALQLRSPTRLARRDPGGFLFAVKSALNHPPKELRDVRTPRQLLRVGVRALGPNLGPALAAPPALRLDLDRIADFLVLLPRTTAAAAELAAHHDERLDGRALTETDLDRPLRHALEVRHESFRDPSFVALLRAHDVALVVADSAGTWPRFDDVTAGFVYVRLHGRKSCRRRLPPDALDRGRRRAGWARGAGRGRSSTTTPRCTRRTTRSRWRAAGGGDRISSAASRPAGSSTRRGMVCDGIRVPER